MANFNLYLTSLVLLVALSWRTSSGVPIHHQPQPSGLDCFSSSSSLSKTLLRHVSELVKDDKFEGEECTVLDDSMMESQTVQLCAPIIPQNSACTSQRNSPFNESECLGSIMKDLSYYHAAIKTYIDAQSAPSTNPLTSAPNNPILRDTMGAIQNLTNCCQVPDEGDHSSQEGLVSEMLWTTTSTTSTFDNKVQMCKVMKAFRSRAITISRAMGYISSGDHKK